MLNHPITSAVMSCVSLAVGAAGVRWSEEKYRWIFEWIVYLSIISAVGILLYAALKYRNRILSYTNMFEPIHFVILGLTIALGGAVYQWLKPSASLAHVATPIRPSILVSNTTGPTYLKNYSIAVEDVGIIKVYWEPAVTVPRLRFFLDYSWEVSAGSWTRRVRIPLPEATDVIKDIRKDFYLTHKTEPNPAARPNYYWGATTQWPLEARTSRLRLVAFSERSEEEQKIYFSVVAPRPQYEVTDDPNQLWISEWEAEDKK